MNQVNTSVCMGMGSVGKKRLKLYHQGIKARGYKSLSRYVIDTLDRELRLEIKKNTRRDIRQAVS